MHRFSVYLSQEDNKRNLPLTACWWCYFEQQNFNFCTIWCSTSDNVQDDFITSFQLPFFSVQLQEVRNFFFSLGAPAQWGTRWSSWLRHCSTSWKVSGSSPVGVIGIFYWHNPSYHTMALGSTQPPTEMSTGNIFWGQRGPVRRADDLTTFMCRLSSNVGASTFWKPQGLPRPIQGLLQL